MPITHRLQCRCGAFHGLLSEPHKALRGFCYCHDCRAYARHLGKLAETHDAQGGAEFVAAHAMNVSFTGGMQHLACLSLTPRGLLRWYAQCCDTPIANTTRDWKLPYVGLIHTCLKSDGADFEAHFPVVRMRVNTPSATQTPPRMPVRTAVALAGFMPRLMLSRLSGSYRQTPFFGGTAGTPVAEVRLLSKEERRLAYEAA